MLNEYKGAVAAAKHLLASGEQWQSGLTRLYAHEAASVLGIDPEEEPIEVARKATPPELRDRVRFEVGNAEDLSQTAVFDVAFLSWSL